MKVFHIRMGIDLMRGFSMKVFHTCRKNCLNYRLVFFFKVDCARDILRINVEGPTEKLHISHDLSKG